MPWRKPIMPPALHVEQLIEWIAVGHPRRAFLIVAEQVARFVERHANSEANSRADDLARLQVGREPDDRPALALEVVLRLPFLIDQQRLREVRRPDSEV